MMSLVSCFSILKMYRIKIIKYGVFFLSICGFIVIGFATEWLKELQTALATSSWLHPLAQVGFIIVLATTTLYIWFAWNAFRYKAVKSVADAELPSLTVVVPAYNEGSLVQQTLRSLATSNYPAEKLQLIAVDDGSQDNTWHYIQKAAKEFPSQIETIRQEQNGGKRRALYEGFNQATGEILVTVDSDSIVDSDTLRNLVSPFVDDPDCGAVAGNVRVLNRKEIIPRMLEVSFVFSFEFIRSAQSNLRTVLCTPGALAAYRRDLVLNVLDEWLNQKFCGREANIGEDRAITNLILRQGKSVLFQRTAMVYTNVPEQYSNLCKMLIRWGRSNVRESLKMASFVFTDFREHHRTSARALCCMQLLWCAPSPILFLMMVSLILLFPLEFLLISVTGGAIWSSVSALFYAARYRNSEAIWAYSYGVFHFCALAWITPYSLLTAGRTGWLTRDINSSSPESHSISSRRLAAQLLAIVQK